MKKLVFLFAAFALSFGNPLFAKKNPASDTVVSEKRASKKELKRLRKEAEVTRKKADKMAKADAGAKKNSGTAKKDGNSGEDSGQVLVKRGADAVVSRGIVRMKTVHENGSVLFYVRHLKKGFIPVVDTANHADSNFIALYADGVEYRLNRSEKADFVFDVDRNSITETFTIKGLAELKAVYSFGNDLESEPDGDNVNSILVNYTVKNISGEPHEFAVKAMHNLVLGENRDSHFSTSAEPEISSETILKPSEKNHWIISSDGKYAVEFVIFGKNITAPEKAVLANKDVLEAAGMTTSFKKGRSFDSLMSYNNSALGLFWNYTGLADNGSLSYSYRINFSRNDFQNAGKQIIIVNPAKAAPEQAAVIPAAEPAVAVPPPAEKTAEPGNVSAGPEDTGDKNYEFDTDLGSIDPSKLNADYVQQLINHINSLEKSDPSLNRLKIQQLQTEIDEVLQVLRSRK